MRWVANCAMCPGFIQEMMREFPDKYILYLDADAEMLRRPSLFLDAPFHYDMAAPFINNRHIGRELVSNTLFFNRTDMAREVVNVWTELQEIRVEQMLNDELDRPYREAWDQRVLQDVIENMAGLSVFELPWEYAKIDRLNGRELMEGVSPRRIVIAQHQASRRNKKLV